MDRVARDPTTVPCPMIDIISPETMEYIYPPKDDIITVGGFNWDLQVLFDMAFLVCLLSAGHLVPLAKKGC